jgi:hypothetical protein
MQLGDALKFDTLTANTVTGDDLLYIYDRDTNTVRTLTFSDGSIRFGAIAQGAPTGGTEGLPRLRTDGDKLYVNVGTITVPVWEAITFDA